MMKWSIRALALLGLLFTPLPALGQGVGQLGSGQIWGNSTAARAPAGPTTVTGIIDRALGSTQGSILYRNATVWVPLTPGTAGLPLVTGGAAANPSYAVLGLSGGGCNAALTASNGGILYSTATACAVLPGTATARQMLQSGASGAPAWSTTTWPATTTINRILFSSAASVVGEISTVNGGLLNANSSGVPGMTITPVLGVPTASTGTLGFAGASSGTATITPQAAAGTPTLTLPNASGTFAVSVSAPLALSATTGNLSITGVANAVLAGSSPAFTPTPTLGTNSGTGGQITLNGSSSGSVALRVAAAAGTSTIFQLPATNGSNTNVLSTDGSGNTSWVPAGAGTVTSVSGAGIATGTVTGSGNITVTAAIKSDQVTATSTTVAVVPGVQQFHPSALKAIAFVTQSGGTYTNAFLYGISGIVKNSTGNLTVTFSTAFTSANFACVGSASEVSTTGVTVTPTAATTATVDIRTSNTAANVDRAFSILCAGTQ